MKYFAIVVFISLLSSPAYADEIAELKDGRRVLLRSDGTYGFMPSTAEPSDEGSYKKIKFEDLRLDLDDLDGEKIEVKALLNSFGDMLMLSEKQFDANPIIADQGQLSREERRFILKDCDSGCRVVIRGVVGHVMFQPGIILHSLVK